MKSKKVVPFGFLLTLALLASPLSGVTAAKADAGSDEPGVAAPVTSDFVYFVSVKIKPGQVLNFKNLALPYIEQTRREAGNVAYLFHQSPDDPTQFGVYEHWQSDEARATHLAAAYTVRFFAEAGPMFEPGYPARKKFIEIR